MILLFRVYAVLPWSRTPRTTYFAIFVPLIALKIARVVVTLMFIVAYVHASKTAVSSVELGQASLHMPYTEIGNYLSVVDNA